MFRDRERIVIRISGLGRCGKGFWQSSAAWSGVMLVSTREASTHCFILGDRPLGGREAFTSGGKIARGISCVSFGQQFTQLFTFSCFIFSKKMESMWLQNLLYCNLCSLCTCGMYHRHRMCHFNLSLNVLTTIIDVWIVRRLVLMVCCNSTGNNTVNNHLVPLDLT